MSAYIQGKAHIDAIVEVALHGPSGREVNPDNAWHRLYLDGAPLGASGDVLGQRLINENIASVAYRYSDTPLTDLPGPIDRTNLLNYQFNGGRRLSAVEALMALDGYEYQSCEHPGWQSSQAKTFIDSLRQQLIMALPGYREADTWSIEEAA